jgi:hypothetical protein
VLPALLSFTVVCCGPAEGAPQPAHHSALPDCTLQVVLTLMKVRLRHW